MHNAQISEKKISVDALFLANSVANSDSNEPTLQSNDVTGVFVQMYETMRSQVDRYSENPFIYDYIERYLKRELHPGSSVKGLASKLLYEGISAGYLENNALPATLINTCQQDIDNWLVLLNEAILAVEPSMRPSMFNECVALLAGKLYFTIAASPDQAAYEAYIYEVAAGAIARDKISAHYLELGEWQAWRSAELWFAMQRIVMEHEHALSLYSTTVHLIPELFNPAQAKASARLYVHYRNALPTLESSPAVASMKRWFRQHFLAFHGMRAVIKQSRMASATELLQSTYAEDMISDTLRGYYIHTQGGIRRALFRSAVAVFIAKAAYAVFVDVPVDIWLLGEVIILPVVSNLLFHPAYLLLSAVFLPLPRKRQRARTVDVIRSMIQGEVEADTLPMRIRTSQTSASRASVFAVGFGLLYLVIFGAIGFALFALDYTIVGIISFILFSAVTVYISSQMRRRYRLLVTLQQNPSLLRDIIETIQMPLLHLGRAFTKFFRRYNVVVLFLDIFLEAPFKLVVRLVREYLREQKEWRDSLLGN